MPKPPTEKKTEVVADPRNDRVRRRRFTKDYILKILAEADSATSRGEIAAILRREGLYSSHLHTWRKQLRKHGEAGLEPKPRGPKPKRDERDRQIDKLECEKAKLEHELLVARKLLDLAEERMRPARLSRSLSGRDPRPPLVHRFLRVVRPSTPSLRARAVHARRRVLRSRARPRSRPPAGAR